MNVMAYTLSTCPFCHEVKRFFYKNKIDYDFVDVDLLEGDERERIVAEAQGFCPGCGYPITVVDGKKVVRGWDPVGLKRALGL